MVRIDRVPCRRRDRRPLLAILALTLTSCDGDGPVRPEVMPPVGGTPESALITRVEVTPNPRSTLAARVTAETVSDAVVRVRVAGPEGNFVTPVTESGRTHFLDVVGLHAESRYDLVVEAFPVAGEPAEHDPVPFTTGALPDGIPPMEVVALEPGAMAPGLTYFGLGSASEDAPLYVAVDEKGSVVWYYRTETPQRVVDADVKIRDDGNLLLHLENEVRTITPGGETVASWSIPEGYHHDALPLPNGNLLILVRETRTVDVPGLGGPQLVTGDAISELDPQGREVWRWSTFDHLDTQRYPGALARRREPYTGGLDWTHANAVIHDPADDALFLSVRSQHWVVKIDRATGEVRWRLGRGGDFQLEGMGDPEWFYGPHAPELLPDGTLLVYDNGNERPDTPTPYSRAVIFHLDEATWTARLTWAYRTPEFTGFLGDVDMLPRGNILVTAGGVFRGGTPRILEVTGGPDPRVVWELKVASLVYRATRIPGFH